MGNMSYCRFSNTLHALRDCYENWDTEVGIDEEKAKQMLFKLCQQIVSDYGEDEEES